MIKNVKVFSNSKKPLRETLGGFLLVRPHGR